MKKEEKHYTEVGASTCPYSNSSFLNPTHHPKVCNLIHRFCFLGFNLLLRKLIAALFLVQRDIDTSCMAHYRNPYRA